MPVADIAKPRPFFRADTQPRESLYDLVPLPDKEWQQRGEALVLPEVITRCLLRYCLYLFHYRREHRLNRLLMLIGPPGTGKSDAVRGIAGKPRHNPLYKFGE
jgi:hypothetical protein